jgi:AcrR family transcriptional regulator
MLQAATYILLKSGYEAMTTNQIAERAGVNIASLYQYFPNKQAILAELAQRHVDAARGALAGKLAELRAKGRAPIRETLRVLAEATCAEHAVEPKLHEILTVWAPRIGVTHLRSDVDDSIAAESRAWAESMRGALPDPELALWIAQTVMHAVLHLAFVERPELAAKPLLVDELVRLLAPFLEPRRMSRVSGRRLRVRRGR